MRYGEQRVLLAVCLGAAMAVAGPAGEDNAGVAHRGRGVWFPEYDEQGRLKSQFFGDEVSVLPGTNMVDVTGLRLELYEEGECTVRVASAECRYDRRTNRAESDEAEVTLTIEEVDTNTAPTITPTTFQVDEETLTFWDLQPYVTDSDGVINWSSLQITETPDHGTLTFDIGPRRLAFTGETNYTGNDSFSIRVADDEGVRERPGVTGGGEELGLFRESGNEPRPLDHLQPRPRARRPQGDAFRTQREEVEQYDEAAVAGRWWRRAVDQLRELLSVRFQE